jgi:hypothetical protein
MATDKQIDAATNAYLKARGWSDETIEQHSATRAEVRDRIIEALKAAEAEIAPTAPPEPPPIAA